MRSIKPMLKVIGFLLIFTLTGCGGGGGGGGAAPVLLSVSVSPADQTVAVGTTLRLVALGTYSNGSVIDLTAGATWTSSAPGVATVSDAAGTKGTVTAVAPGSATISATVGGVSASTPLTVAPGVAAGANVMTVTVNGALCSPLTSLGYFNKPCVSVTVCNPGTAVCQTVNDILLDTGSYGLRIFKQALTNLSLPQVTSGSGSLAGCMQFADGTALWGPIKLAAVQLGGEPPVQMPIQVIDSAFSTRPVTCTNADADPVAAGFTGILGVGIFPQDCGTACASSAAIGIYYSCTASGCTGTTVPLASQVRNPASALPQDNNGLIVQIPPVPLTGATSTVGSLIFGIGTRANNIPSPGSVTVFPTNDVGDFTTVFRGFTFNESNGGSFLDTGSNAYYIPNVAPTLLPPCPSPNSDWYCPAAVLPLTATTFGDKGAPSAEVPFTVANFATLYGSFNSVFNDVAGVSSFGFDWGLPFFLGREVYYGYQGATVPALGAPGPFVAY